MLVSGVQNLGGQVVGDVPVIRGELLDLLVGRGALGQPECSEADTRRPAFGAVHE
jgi:hypothetical protein